MRRSLDAPPRPSQPSQRDDLLFLFLRSRHCSRDGAYSPRQIQCPDSAIALAGFQVSLYGRFWVSPEEIFSARPPSRIGSDNLGHRNDGSLYRVAESVFVNSRFCGRYKLAERMWRFAVACLLAVILLIAAGRVARQRRKRRQNRLMRDHLNKISPDLGIGERLKKPPSAPVNPRHPRLSTTIAAAIT